MTIQEFITRFPEIPADLHNESLLAEYAETFGGLLRIASKPSACSTEYDAGNHYYLQLVGPMDIYRYGLSTKEKVLTQLQDLLNQHKNNPDGFAACLLPTDIASKEVKGPGCE